MDLHATGDRVGRIEDHVVNGCKARGYFHGVAEVLADGDWHELDVAVADNADAKTLCTKEQGVGRDDDRVSDRGQVEVGEDIGPWAQDAFCVVDIHFYVEG